MAGCCRGRPGKKKSSLYLHYDDDDPTLASEILLQKESKSQIRMINEDLSIPEQKVTYSVRDVLELIPTFSGADACEYIHFQEGCMEALELIGPENERTLLKFLKTKLKGNALTRFSLHVARYDRLMRFLQAIKKEYNLTATHDGDFWLGQMSALKQKKGEPVREYGKRFENLLQCAIIATEPGFHIKTDADKSPVKKIEVEVLESQAFANFQKNISSNELQGYLIKSNYHLKARNMLDIICAAELWESVIRKRANSIPKNTLSCFDRFILEVIHFVKTLFSCKVWPF